MDYAFGSIELDSLENLKTTDKVLANGPFNLIADE